MPVAPWSALPSSARAGSSPTLRRAVSPTSVPGAQPRSARPEGLSRPGVGRNSHADFGSAGPRSQGAPTSRKSTAARSVAPAAAAGPEAPAWLPFKLRTAVLLGAAGLLGWAAYPRAVAAWTLHTAAAAFADYALCMAGPKGPDLLRDASPEFAVLLRRRLIAAGPDDRPFERCAGAVRDIGAAAEVQRAHRAAAASFVEYAAPGAKADLTLDRLAVGTKPISELYRAAWPFARGGWTRLIHPSLDAKEATHPLELAQPRLGRGLPTWRAQYRSLRKTSNGWLLAIGAGANLSVHRSLDSGLTWAAASTSEPGLEEFRERCSAPGAAQAFTFGLSDDARSLVVTSQGPDGPPQSTTLGGADARVLGTSCDASGLFVALGDGQNVNFSLCRYRGGCAPVVVPAFAQVAPKPPLDVARVDGALVVAVATGALTRVASSRDDGVTWTPWAVAYDRDAEPDAIRRLAPPTRLLALERRVILYAGSARNEPYPVLVSDDQGASWRTP